VYYSLEHELLYYCSHKYLGNALEWNCDPLSRLLCTIFRGLIVNGLTHCQPLPFDQADGVRWLSPRQTSSKLALSFLCDQKSEI
jgi:hypothetical protein